MVNCNTPNELRTMQEELKEIFAKKCIKLMQNQEGEAKDKEGKGPAQTLPNLDSNNPRKTL